MAINLGIAEILQLVSKEKSRKQQVKILQQNSSGTLKMVLGYAFDPGVVWLLPEGIPQDPETKEYMFTLQPKSAGLQNQLFAETAKMGLFLKGNPEYDVPREPKNQKQWDVKRETIFLDMLSPLDPDDALLMCDVKDKHISYNGVTAKLTALAFPNLTKNWDNV